MKKFIIILISLCFLISTVNADNRVHRSGNIWLNVNNHGMFGNQYEGRNNSDNDPETGEWAPQCEFPGGSGAQYLFFGGIWIGALIQAEGYEYPRVSTAHDGWVVNIECNPTSDNDSRIVESSNIAGAIDYLGNDIYNENAVAPEEYTVIFADTLTDPFYVDEDPIDSVHVPLGVKISQKSMAWDACGYEDFILFEWEVENVGNNYLKNLYIGFYIDGDIGHKDEQDRFVDDVCGYREWHYFENANGEIDSMRINAGWIADNDGRPHSVSSGTDFTAPGVAGVMLIDSPNPEAVTSFNWWCSNGDPDLDFGPSWKDDGAPGGWTDVYGTPMGDEKKYFVMRNRENDYDFVYMDDPEYIRAHPQYFRDRWDPEIILETHEWKIPGVDDDTPPGLIHDIANGYDSRFLISKGPFGIFDHVDEAGNRIYRLNPGEKFTLTFALVCGENFHDRNNPQQSDELIDPAKYNFADFGFNCMQALDIYDKNYDIPHPHAPQELTIIPGFKKIWISWDDSAIEEGVIVNVFRREEGEEFDEDPINSEPISGSQYADYSVELGRTYFYKAQSNKESQYFSIFTPEVSIQVGAPSTPTGLEADAGNGFVELSWNHNPEANVNRYKIYRTILFGEAGLDSVIGTISETTFRDEDVENGNRYAYLISAMEHHDLESAKSDTVIAIPMGFDRDLLIIRDIDFSRDLFDWPEEELISYYDILFADAGESPEYLTPNNGIPITLSDLSPYLTTWIIRDNRSGYDNWFEVTAALIDYVEQGGSLIISGSSPFYKVLNVRSGFRKCEGIDAGLFHIDSVYVTNPPGSVTDFSAAVSMKEGFPSLRIDSSKVMGFWRGENPYFLSTDALYSGEDGEIIYSFEAYYPDTSRFQDSGVGARYLSEEYCTTILTFPLYAMQPYDAVVDLTRMIIADIRAARGGGEFYGIETQSGFASFISVHPNPFNDLTMINFKLNERTLIDLSVYDVSGRRISKLANGSFTPGTHFKSFRTSNLSAGLYFVRLATGDQVSSTKIILIK